METFHDHRQHHRPALQLLVDERRQVVVQVVLEQVDLAHLLLGRARQRVVDGLAAGFMAAEIDRLARALSQAAADSELTGSLASASAGAPASETIVCAQSRRQVETLPADDTQSSRSEPQLAPRFRVDRTLSRRDSIGRKAVVVPHESAAFARDLNRSLHHPGRVASCHLVVSAVERRP
jgi:hypothetical protein